jgi:CheY-like chemotaxis protein
MPPAIPIRRSGKDAPGALRELAAKAVKPMIAKDACLHFVPLTDDRSCDAPRRAQPRFSATPAMDPWVAGQALDDIRLERLAMVVDNHPTIRQTVSAMLERMGWTVTQADDSRLAVWYLARADFDLMIADFDLASMNGCELALRAKRRSSQTKTIIMTVRCQAEMADWMQTGDVDGWLFKPYKIGELSAKLNTLGLSRTCFAKFQTEAGMVAGRR